MHSRWLLKQCLITILLLGCGESAFAQSAPAPSQPVVVELFQSQGCSSCPPAEANLNAIAGQPNVLALSFAVTYWDSLGWKDTFATAAYTDRQWMYAHHRRRNQVWTPQVFVDGHADLIGSDRAQLDQAVALARSHSAARPALTWTANSVSISAGDATTSCDVWLVRYDPRTLQVAIGAGENSGRTLPHRNVVRQLLRLGSWKGSQQTFALPASTSDGLLTAALVQVHAGGDIIGASIQTSP